MGGFACKATHLALTTNLLAPFPVETGGGRGGLGCSSCRAQGGFEAGEAELAVLDEAFDALQNPVRGQVGFFHDLVDVTASSPAIVPVRREGVRLGDLVVQPVVHQAAGTVGDRHRVDPVGRGDNRPGSSSVGA